MTTKPYEFPQSRVQSTGGGPDFPGSAGDRERGKFRPSATPRLTQVAVSGDDGPVIRTTDQILEEVLLYQKAILLALSLTAHGESFVPEDILAQV